MACCDGITTLSVQSFCEVIALPLIATETGVHTIIRQNRDMSILKKTFTIGEEIEFDNIYSESDVITFQVKDPSGAIMKDADENDCFRIKIIPFKNVIIS